jgi:hypothetical protein
VSDDEPRWLREAPDKIEPLLRLGYEQFGDDHPRVLEWLRNLVEYKTFWNIVEGKE